MSKKNIVDQILKELLSTVKSAKEFGKEQLPDLGRQILEEWVITVKFELFEELLGVAVGLLVGAISAYLVIKAPILMEDGRDVVPLRVCASVVGGLVFSAITFINASGAIASLSELYRAKKTPKAVLLGLIANKLRG